MLFYIFWAAAYNGTIMSNILIVEDNPSLNNAYKLILEKEGHAVTVAFNGLEGLDKLEQATPDIILLDLLMPKMGGLEFLKKLNDEGKLRANGQKSGKGKQLTIIVLSNLNQDEEVQQALDLGAYKYILKADTSPRELAVRVNHLLDRL